MKAPEEKAERSGPGKEVHSWGLVFSKCSQGAVRLALGKTGKSGLRTNPSVVRAQFSGTGTGRMVSGSNERDLRNRTKVKTCHWYKTSLKQGGIGGALLWKC